MKEVLKTRNSQNSITFLGEKVLGVFSRNYEFARDHPQQLNDQSNVVCHFAWQQKGGLLWGLEKSGVAEGDKTNHIQG